MVRTVIVARDLDFDYSKERWSGQKERIGCALKIETVSRNKWRKCKMSFLSGHHYFLRLCVPVIYTSRLQSKIATGKRSLSHRAFSSTAFVSERVSSVRFMPGYWDYFEEMVRRSARPHILQSIERNAIAIDSLFMRICREWIRMIKFIRLYSKLCNHTLIDRH